MANSQREFTNILPHVPEEDDLVIQTPLTPNLVCFSLSFSTAHDSYFLSGRRNTSRNNRSYTLSCFSGHFSYHPYPRMTFCQIVLDEKLIKSVDKNPFGLPWWPEMVAHHKKRHPRDPIHIPFRDPEPQVTTPFTKEHPWHTQVNALRVVR